MPVRGTVRTVGPGRSSTGGDTSRTLTGGSLVCTDGGREVTADDQDDRPTDADRETLADADRVVVLNPVSGGGDHTEQVRELAAERGYAVVETAAEGDGVALARAAADAGVDLVAAAGGDGTVNEVVRGVDAAGALDAVTVGVVPAGTGNNFAGNLGVTGVAAAFDVLETGERRHLDLGVADDRPFVNSCVGGLTAEASGETDTDSKERFGVLAYALTTLRLLGGFEGVRLTVESVGDEPAWSGTALLVLVGNARGFGPGRHARANAEDGLLDVAVVESAPSAELLEEAAAARLFGTESDHVVHFRTPGLTVDVGGADPLECSLDGEIERYDRLSVGVRPGALEIPVGEGYVPDPDPDGGDEGGGGDDGRDGGGGAGGDGVDGRGDGGRGGA